jgi:hypothetical protein
MTQKVLEDFIAQIRGAAASEDRKSTIRALLQESQCRKDLMADAIAALEEDEVMFFEDETCSIWTCRYDPNVVFAVFGLWLHSSNLPQCRSQVK